jgi:hypothetical protein
MDTSYGRAVALAVPVFVSAIAVEFVIDRVRRTRYLAAIFPSAATSIRAGVIS